MAIPERAFLRPAEAAQLVGLSVPSLYRLARQGDFPRMVKLGPHSSGFVATEVHDWCERRIAAARREVA